MASFKQRQWSRELWFKFLLHFCQTQRSFACSLWCSETFLFASSDEILPRFHIQKSAAAPSRHARLKSSHQRRSVLQRHRSSISFTSPCLFFPSPGFTSVFTPLMSPPLNAGFSNNACVATVMDSYSQEPDPRQGARGERDGCLCLQVQYDEAFNILTRQMSAIKVNNIPPSRARKPSEELINRSEVWLGGRRRLVIGI